MVLEHQQLQTGRAIRVRCRLFARYAELTGTDEVTLVLPQATTVAGAVRLLRDRLPGGSSLPERPLAAVNAVHALPAEPLQEGDELALLPPVAGGSPQGLDQLTRSVIDVGKVIAVTADTGLGGTAVFVGTVRRGGEDGAVVAIEYSAYEEMACAELDRIAGEVGERWPQARVAAQHRLGMIPAGEASIAVAAAAPHRDEAFAACRYVIEEIKRRLPVWKKEVYEDGSAAWRGNDGTRGAAASR